MQVEPTPEAVEAALLCAERKAAGDFDIASEILAHAYRALLEKQPRIWTAETIGEAPEGWYRMRRVAKKSHGWPVTLFPKEVAIALFTQWGDAFGPIPQPEGEA